MPDYFWSWYEDKGYSKFLAKEICYTNKAFLIGCCIEYLTEKGQKINNLNEKNNLNEIVDYFKIGVAWTK